MWKRAVCTKDCPDTCGLLAKVEDGRIVINPEIIAHTRHTVDSKEACLSYPDRPETTVQRWNKCVVEYLTLEDDNKRLTKKRVNLSSIDAKVWQHEIDHFNAEYVYDDKES